MSRHIPDLDLNDISRRDLFRRAACAAVGATALVSTVWDLRLINAAIAQSSSIAAITDYKAMVCVFLYGGNDANNLIIPTNPEDFPTYQSKRGPLALTAAS